MKAEEPDLPVILAPPLAPDASFDADLAAGFEIDWLAVQPEPMRRPSARRRAA